MSVRQLRHQQAMCRTAVRLGVAWDHAVDVDSLTAARVEVDDDDLGGASEPRAQLAFDVIPDQEAAFEAAFAEAKFIISAMPGFRALRLSRCVERPNRYLLLVEWDRLEDHTEGFRGSPQYESWRALLHHFYDPFPVVEHYKDIESLGTR